MKLDSHVVAQIQALVETLQGLLNQVDKSSTRHYQNIFASTTEIQQITGQYFYWKPLRDYCKLHDLPIMRVTINGLEINSYPAQAWAEIYEVDIASVLAQIN